MCFQWEVFALHCVLPEDVHLILERLGFISQSCELFILGFHIHKFFFKFLTTNPVVVFCCLQPTGNWDPWWFLHSKICFGNLSAQLQHGIRWTSCVLQPLTWMFLPEAAPAVFAAGDVCVQQGCLCPLWSRTGWVSPSGPGFLPTSYSFLLAELPPEEGNDVRGRVKEEKGKKHQEGTGIEGDKEVEMERTPQRYEMQKRERLEKYEMDFLKIQSLAVFECASNY